MAEFCHLCRDKGVSANLTLEPVFVSLGSSGLLLLTSTGALDMLL